jgi:transposase
VVKNVPGRKTDVNDATWLADLMAHGLVRGSFVPDEQTQEMRDFLRTRKQFVRERSSRIQRTQKTSEDANIKLDFRHHRHHWTLWSAHDRGNHRR